MSTIDDRLTAAWITRTGCNPIAARKPGELEPRTEAPAAAPLSRLESLRTVSRLVLALAPGDRAAVLALRELFCREDTFADRT